MRASTVIITIVVAALCWVTWWALDILSAATQVSGGSYGSHETSDSTIQSFVVLGLIAAPLTVWLIRAIAKESKNDSSGEDHNQNNDASPPTA